MKLYPVEDTYVSQYEPNANFGGKSTLEVAFSDNMFILNKKTYIKFDLSQIPSNANIESAILNLYTGVIVLQTQQILVLYCSDNSWRELTLTWNNMPNYDTRGWVLSVAKASMWYSYSINQDSEGIQMQFVTRARWLVPKLIH